MGVSQVALVGGGGGHCLSPSLRSEVLGQECGLENKKAGGDRR